MIIYRCRLLLTLNTVFVRVFEPLGLSDLLAPKNEGKAMTNSGEKKIPSPFSVTDAHQKLLHVYLVLSDKRQKTSSRCCARAFVGSNVQRSF